MAKPAVRSLIKLTEDAEALNADLAEVNRQIGLLFDPVCEALRLSNTGDKGLVEYQNKTWLIARNASRILQVSQAPVDKNV